MGQSQVENSLILPETWLFLSLDPLSQFTVSRGKIYMYFQEAKAFLSKAKKITKASSQFPCHPNCIPDAGEHPLPEGMDRLPS